jgi:hypothetical protein
MEKTDIIGSLLPLHALINLSIFLLFMFQASLGLRIRSARKAASPPAIKAIRLHRRLGPVLVLLGVSGFFSGWIIVFYHYCNLFHYPLHSLTGLSVALMIMITFYISKNIRGADSHWRTIHFSSGLILLCLYAVQIFLGIGIFF